MFLLGCWQSKVTVQKMTQAACSRSGGALTGRTREKRGEERKRGEQMLQVWGGKLIEMRCHLSLLVTVRAREGRGEGDRAGKSERKGRWGRLGEVWSHLCKKVGWLKPGTECLCVSTSRENFAKKKRAGSWQNVSVCVCKLLSDVSIIYKSRYMWVVMHRDFISTKFTSSTYMQQPHSHTRRCFWQRSMHEYA